MMKLLYATGRYNPLKHDEGSGEDYNLYQSFLNNGFSMEIVGPLEDRPGVVEKIYRKFHGVFSKKRYAKYSSSLLKNTSNEVHKTLAWFQPDVLFSHNLSAFVKLQNSDVPIVYMMDAPLMGTEAQWPLFSQLEYKRMLAWEKTVLHKAARIVTRSQWAIDYLTNEYNIPNHKIVLIQAASSLPERVIPSAAQIGLLNLDPLHLLLVGRVYKLKGIDTAIEIVNHLNQTGIKAELRIVGLDGDEGENYKFMGSFKKTDEQALNNYADQYRWAHFLLHPARYDSAPIVTAEAAAFGVPTLTNAVGGIATTVQDGVSGRVLPALSPAEEYVTLIRYYVEHPDEYRKMRLSSRERYERELNWKVVGDSVVGVIRQVVAEQPR